MLIKDFFKEKRVLITGNTGFKGSWLSQMLLCFGAYVEGYSLDIPTDPAFFTVLHLDKHMQTTWGDIRDYHALKSKIDTFKPEIIFHLAAQPIVIEGYKSPLYTYETNILGTLNVLECARICDSVKSVVSVTTDKVYRNMEWDYVYREIDVLDGFDPYSNSKSCADILGQCYKRCYMDPKGVAFSNVRAGNVIGGGDFAKYRIIPDCVRALFGDGTIVLRNPDSIRPYQHVLEPLYAYCMVAEQQYENICKADNYNVGPATDSFITTRQLVSYFADAAERKMSKTLQVYFEPQANGVHESKSLKLDCEKIKAKTGWKPHWNVVQAVEETVEWVAAYLAGDATICTERQINKYLSMDIE